MEVGAAHCFFETKIHVSFKFSTVKAESDEN